MARGRDEVAAQAAVMAVGASVTPELLRALNGVPAADLRRGAAFWTGESLQCRPAAVRTALVVLRRRADPAAFFRTVPQAAPWVAAALAAGCALDTIDALGEAHEDPTREQLIAAVASVSEHRSREEILLMLELVAASALAAAPVCASILADEPGYARPAAEPPAAPAEPTLTEPGRGRVARARAGAPGSGRTRPGQRRSAPPTARPRYRRRRSPAPDDASPAPTPCESAPGGVSPGPHFRAPRLTLPAGFDSGHDLVGAVVWADVPFDAEDPAEPGLTSKRRPCVVVAASPRELAVRAAYTGDYQVRRWQTVQLADWREAGLDGPSVVEDTVRTVPRTDGTTQVVGWHTARDWNALW